MRLTIGTALRPILELLTLAMLFPFLTGFDVATPDPDSMLTPPALPASSLQPKPLAAPEQSASAFSWRRDPMRESNLLAAAEPGAANSNLAAVEPGAANFNAAPETEKRLSWETGAGSSYLIPALEVPGFLVLLNIFDRLALKEKDEQGRENYNTNFSTAWQHLRQQNWHFDNNTFNVNQIGHPYQGATMYGLARSSGLGFWASLAYSNAGSFLWEMAGETGRPSTNDLITTGNSGSLLGEALFRMAALVLKEKETRPDGWHELAAALLSPPTAFNRYAFGDRFKTTFSSHDPATFWRLRLGASLSGNSQQNATMDFAMSYGLPGKAGYSYQRPLDYFDFQISGLSRANNPISSVLLRGLLYGREYGTGDNYRGIWGLYGSYDYLSPTVFRVSTTALSLGSTAQCWMAHELALQGSLVGGVGFGAAGVTPRKLDNRDYHYGVTPHLLLALRLIYANRAALDLIGRGYFVSGTGSDNSEGSEKLARINTGITFRIYRRHGIGLQFVESIRDAQYGRRAGKFQSDGTLSLVYTFLGDSHFGAVEWRDVGSR